LNAAIAEVAHGEQELYHRTGYQSQQLAAGQQIYNAGQAELQQAGALSQYDRDIMSFKQLSGSQQ